MHSQLFTVLGQLTLLFSGNNEQACCGHGLSISDKDLASVMFTAGELLQENESAGFAEVQNKVASKKEYRRSFKYYEVWELMRSFHKQSIMQLKDQKTKRLKWRITFSHSIGKFLFGYFFAVSAL